jgi:hypothetical protein
MWCYPEQHNYLLKHNIMEIEEAIEIAKNKIGVKRSKKQPCVGAIYEPGRFGIGQPKESEPTSKKGRNSFDNPHWVISFKIPCPEDVRIEPSENIVVVWENGEVEEMPVM